MTATESKERNKGRTANDENSGPVGVGVGFGVGEFVVEVSGMVNVCVPLQSLIVPLKLKS